MSKERNAVIGGAIAGALGFAFVRYLVPAEDQESLPVFPLSTEGDQGVNLAVTYIATPAVVGALVGYFGVLKK
jgi:thiamine biosynthesis protein ThiC